MAKTLSVDFCCMCLKLGEKLCKAGDEEKAVKVGSLCETRRVNRSASAWYNTEPNALKPYRHTTLFSSYQVLATL